MGEDDLDRSRARERLKECAEYFRLSPGFKRILGEMRKKYLSLGSCGGTVTLQKLSEAEKQALSGLLRRDYLHSAGASVKLADFQKALDSTRFAGLLLEDILKEYFKEDLISNRQVQSLYESGRRRFFQELLEHFRSTPGGIWLEAAVNSKAYGYKSFVQRYDSGPEELKRELIQVCTAVNNLPYLTSSRFSLPVFASKITSDPHGFDEDMPAGPIFLSALAFHLGCPRPFNTFERSELLYKAGILIDEVSNTVLCSGLLAAGADGKPHEGWSAFYNRGEVFQASLMNLSNLSGVANPMGKVFVVENPAVFSYLHSKIREHYGPREGTQCSPQEGIRESLQHSPRDDLQETPRYRIHEGPNETARVKDDATGRYLAPGLVCTYGQVNLSGFILLDFLAASGSRIWYSGDMDPEGILIADRLKTRYGSALKLWRYSVEDYRQAASQCVASPRRLGQLKNVASPELDPLVRQIQTERRCGYQELLLEKLAEDVI